MQEARRANLGCGGAKEFSIERLESPRAPGGMGKSAIVLDAAPGAGSPYVVTSCLPNQTRPFLTS